jgi:hypothetical protein
MNGEKTEALAAIRGYARLQAELLAATQRVYPEMDRDEYLLSLDRTGTVQSSDEIWTFRRHGRGICYTGTVSHRTVDVHSDGVQYPRGFDSWRLAQYFESLGTAALWFEGHPYEASDIDAVDEILAAMAHCGAIERVPRHASLCVVMDGDGPGTSTVPPGT